VHFNLGKVFISHTSVDKPFVRRLAKRLEKLRFQVWLDERDLIVGDSLPASVGKALHAAKVILVVVSKASIASKWLRYHYETCDVEVEANSFVGKTDVVRYSAKLRTGSDPIYCHAIQLSDTTTDSQIDETRWRMVDESRNKEIKCLYLPMQDGDVKTTRELLMFFDPILPPNSGPYSLLMTDYVENLTKPLLETGRDEVVFLPRRALGNVGQINLIFHYPRRYRVEFRNQSGGQEGAPMSQLELLPYRRSAPDGFETIGWKGVNLKPDTPFGADVFRIDN
jgi:TIR domain